MFFLLCLCAASSSMAAQSVISRDTAFAREMLALINAERQKAGYPLLAEEAKLNAAAKERLSELFRSFNNTRPGGGSLGDLVKKHSVSFSSVSQTYGRNYSTPAKAVAAFKKNGYDCIHRDIYHRAGIAVGNDSKGVVHYVIISVSSLSSGMFSGEYGAAKKNILTSINIERRKKGLPPIHYEPGLDAAATIRSGELVKKYASERPDGSSSLSLFSKYAASLATYSNTYGKEKLTPDAFAAAWEKKIAAPKALEKKYTSLGIGMTISNGTLYWCAVSVEPRNFKTYAELEAFRKEVLSLTNAERAKHGLAALKSDTALDKVGDARAGELLRYYDGEHLRPDKRKWSTILAEYKISWKYCGENISRGQKTPKEAVTGWMNSPGHKANILNKNYTHLGVGVRMTSNGDLYWSQNFIAFADTKAAALQSSGTSASKQTAGGVSGSTLASDVQKHIGVKYVWGGTTPKGFDCSGLVYYVCKQYGITIPRTSAEQSAKAGRAVAKKDLKPGDLVFFGRTSSGPVDHVGMYIGNDTYVHAPNPDYPVMKTKFSNNSFVKNGKTYTFQGKFVNARRVVN
ncbi:CAP domain-containing protein [Desulfovibrio sp. OttesenSCG-928-C06]|nr:CAP domain-containing protein [Desulfovibrio sp. OttesenSCG-928-C06]